MGTITKMGEQRMDSFRQNPINIESLIQPGWEDAAEYMW
jgi:hypothetical protein